MASPNTFEFTAGGQTGSFTVSQLGFAGPFNASVDHTNVATIAPASQSASTAGEAVTFTLTAVGAGTATATVTGAGGQYVTVSIGVTTTGGTIQARRRHP